MKLCLGNPVAQCFHGGVTASLIKYCGDICSMTTLNNNNNNNKQNISCIDLRIDYLKPVPSYIQLNCKSFSNLGNNNIIIINMECWDENYNNLFAIGRGVYKIINN